MTSSSGVLDTSTEGNVGNVLPITTETVITLDVVLKTGTHNNSRVMLQHSPNITAPAEDVVWIDDPHSTNGTGSVTLNISTTAVRPCVLDGEGDSASAQYFITAK